MTDLLPQKLRSDAQENRDRVLEAARDLFAASGLDVTMREVARHAGVGPATLYRRFPTKQDLLRDAFHDELRACEGIVRDAAADPDAWRGFCTIIERIIELNSRNRGFTEAFLSTYPDAFDFRAHRVKLTRQIAQVAARAQATGELRADFSIDDFILILQAARGITHPGASRGAGRARRFAALAIDGLRA